MDIYIYIWLIVHGSELECTFRESCHLIQPCPESVDDLPTSLPTGPCFLSRLPTWKPSQQQKCVISASPRIAGRPRSVHCTHTKSNWALSPSLCNLVALKPADGWARKSATLGIPLRDGVLHSRPVQTSGFIGFLTIPTEAFVWK